VRVSPKILLRKRLKMVIAHTTLKVITKHMRPGGLVGQLVPGRIKQMITEHIARAVTRIGLVIARVIAHIVLVIALVIGRIGPAIIAQLITAQLITKVSELLVSLQPGIRLSPGLSPGRYTLRMCLGILGGHIRSNILLHNNL
jgi:hypothetical protein